MVDNTNINLLLVIYIFTWIEPGRLKNEWNHKEAQYLFEPTNFDSVHEFFEGWYTHKCGGYIIYDLTGVFVFNR